MSKSDTNFWTGPASASYRFVAGGMGAFMVAGAILFLYVGLQEDRWRMLMWVPLLLLNAGGLAGVAWTGRWWGFRRSAGR